MLALHVVRRRVHRRGEGARLRLLRGADRARLVAVGLHPGGDRGRGRPPRPRLRLPRRGGADRPRTTSSTTRATACTSRRWPARGSRSWPASAACATTAATLRVRAAPARSALARLRVPARRSRRAPPAWSRSTARRRPTRLEAGRARSRSPTTARRSTVAAGRAGHARRSRRCRARDRPRQPPAASRGAAPPEPPAWQRPAAGSGDRRIPHAMSALSSRRGLEPAAGERRANLVRPRRSRGRSPGR